MQVAAGEGEVGEDDEDGEDDADEALGEDVEGAAGGEGVAEEWVWVIGLRPASERLRMGHRFLDVR